MYPRLDLSLRQVSCVELRGIFHTRGNSTGGLTANMGQAPSHPGPQGTKFRVIGAGMYVHTTEYTHQRIMSGS